MTNDNLIKNYSRALEFIKSAGQYAIIFTILNISLGYIHISSYLLVNNNFWLIDMLEYKTIFSWGLPFSILIIINSIHVFSDHLDYDSKPNFQKPIVKNLFILVVIYICILIFYIPLSKQFNPFIVYPIVSILISVWLSDISVIVDYLRFKEKITGNTVIWSTTAPIFVILAISFYGGLKGWFVLKYNDYSNFASFHNIKYGVLVNNNNTVILADLNQSSKIRIIKVDKIDYFIKDISSVTNQKDNKP